MPYHPTIKKQNILYPKTMEKKEKGGYRTESSSDGHYAYELTVTDDNFLIGPFYVRWYFRRDGEINTVIGTIRPNTQIPCPNLAIQSWLHYYIYRIADDFSKFEGTLEFYDDNDYLVSSYYLSDEGQFHGEQFELLYPSEFNRIEGAYYTRYPKIESRPKIKLSQGIWKLTGDYFVQTRYYWYGEELTKKKLAELLEILNLCRELINIVRDYLDLVMNREDRLVLSL